MPEHKELGGDALSDIASYTREARKLLGLWWTKNPRRIVKAVHQCVLEIRDLSGEFDEDELGGGALRYGCLWGNRAARPAEIHQAGGESSV